jgi:hypothetical protein
VQKLALVLTLAHVALVGCQRPAEQPKTETPASTQPDTNPPAVVEPAAAAPIVYFVGSQLWRIEADGSDARSLDFEVSPANPGMDEAIGEGDSTPTISRDGRLLAWADSVDLWITEFTPAGGASKSQITKMPPRVDDWIMAASISFSTWSPDSSTLVVMLREPGYEEENPLPLPAGVQYGFHVLRASERKLVHAPHIEGVYGWTPDSKAVLNDKYISQANYELLAHPVEPGPAKLLRTSTDLYGFSQLQVEGDWFAWTSGGGGSQIFIAPIAGGEPRPMSPQAAFADIQWPAVAPDGAHVTFQLKGQTQLSASPEQTKPLPIGIALQWFDAEHLLAVSNEGLVLLDLDGNAKVLDPAGTGLVRR